MRRNYDVVDGYSIRNDVDLDRADISKSERDWKHRKVKSEKRAGVAALLITLLISEACAMAGVIPGLSEEIPRHKGGRRRKKTWIEKQQSRRGWRE